MIGERLKDLRNDANLTQEDLGNILYVTGHTIGKYEKDINTPNDETKVKIAKYFGVSLDYLCGLIREELPYNRHAKNTYLLKIPSCVPPEKVEIIKAVVNAFAAEARMEKKQKTSKK